MNGLGTTMTYEFMTKLGKCTIDSEKLSLTRGGVIGKSVDKTIGTSISLWLVFYSILSISSFAFSVNFFLHNSYAYGTVFILIGFWLAYSVLKSFSYSGTNIVERSEVEKITVHKPRPPLMRGYLVVHFLRDGIKKKRVVMLPGSMSGGEEEFKRAQQILHESGWDEFIV